MQGTQFTTHFFWLLKDIFVLNRNTATHTVEQELLFVGQEAGKLLAVRDIVQKVSGLIFITVEQRKDHILRSSLQNACFGIIYVWLTDCTSVILCLHFSRNFFFRTISLSLEA